MLEDVMECEEVQSQITTVLKVEASALPHGDASALIHSDLQAKGLKLQPAAYCDIYF